jgi:MFS family permease
MHPWLVFLHVIGVFGFLLAHGVSAGAAFALRRERNPERVRALLELSLNSYRVMYLSLYGLLLTGIIAGFTGNWWGRGWIWVSLILLIAIVVAMMILGAPIYDEARKAAGLPYRIKGKPQPPVKPASAAELGAQVAKGNPMLLTVIGFGGIAVIAWLMMFKPF